MSEPTPEAIEAAARAIYPHTRRAFDSTYEHIRERCREQARAALSAAAPYLIREAQARALEDAAEAAEGMHDPSAPDCREWADWLRARAAAIRDGAE
jgi:dienelactone hydrolase